MLIGGGIPRETEVASQYIAKQIEIDRPANAAAVSVTLLLISFAVLFAIRCVARSATRTLTGVKHARLALRIVALGYLVALVLVPLGMIFFRTFEDGFVAFWESVTTPGGDLGDLAVADDRRDRRAAQRRLRRSSRRSRSRAGDFRGRGHRCRRSSTCRSRSRR